MRVMNTIFPSKIIKSIGPGNCNFTKTSKIVLYFTQVCSVLFSGVTRLVQIVESATK